MKQMVKDQKLKKAAEVAAYTVEDVASKISALDREVKYLINKAKMWVPKPKKTDTNTTESAGGDETTKPAGEEAPETQEEKPPQSTDSAQEETTEETTAGGEGEGQAETQSSGV